MPKIAQHTSLRLRRSLGVAMGVAALSAPLAAGIAPANAAPTQPSGQCSFTYPNPNLFALSTLATASVTQTGRDTIRVRVVSRPYSIAGYQQKVSVTWANLRTGRSGSTFSAPTRVGGLESTVTVPRIRTGSGRITLVVGATNTSSINPNATTNGDCGTEVVVR